MSSYTGAGAFSAAGAQTLTWGQPIEVEAADVFNLTARVRLVFSMDAAKFNIGLRLSNGSTLWAAQNRTVAMDAGNAMAPTEWVVLGGEVTIPAGVTSATMLLQQTAQLASFEVDEFKASDLTLQKIMSDQVTAASDSARIASAKATEAGQFATSLATAVTQAQTAATTATSKQQEVAQALQTAEGWVASARSSSELSAAAKDAVLENMSSAGIIPSSFASNEHWSISTQGSRDGISYAPASYFVKDTANAPVFRRAMTANGAVAVHRTLLPAGDRAYRVTIRYMLTQLGSTPPRLNFGVSFVNEDGSSAASEAFAGATPVITAAHTQIQTYSVIVSAFEADDAVRLASIGSSPYVRIYPRVSSGTGTVTLYSLTIEDVTSAIKSAVSAKASAKSFTDASALKSGFDQSAQVASGAKADAVTAAGSAASSADLAVTSQQEATRQANLAKSDRELSVAAAAATVITGISGPILPKSFDAGLSFYSSTIAGGAPEANTQTLRMTHVSNDADFGNAAEVVSTANGHGLAHRGVLPAGDAIYRMTAKIKVMSGTGTVGLSVRRLSATYGSQDPTLLASVAAPQIGQVITLTKTFGFAAEAGVDQVIARGTSLAHLRAYVAGTNATAVTFRVGMIEFLDVTAEVRARAAATAAMNDRDTAWTHMDNASKSAGTARSSMDTAVVAAGDAGRARDAATLAYQDADRAMLAARDASDLTVRLVSSGALLPSDFAMGLTHWTSNRNHNPTSSTQAVSKMAAATDSALGPVVIWSPTAAGDNFMTRGVMPHNSDNIYRITARMRVDAPAAGVSLNLIACPLNAAYVHDLGQSPSFILTPEQGVTTLTVLISGRTLTGVYRATQLNNADRPFIRLGIRMNSNNASSIVVQSLKVEDATAEYLATQAAVSATASEGIAVQAVQDAAGSAASALASSRIAAMAMSNGLNTNPVFSDWAGSAPAAHTLVNGAGTFSKTTGRYGNAVMIDSTSSTAVGPYLAHLTSANGGPANPSKVLVTAEIELVSGSALGCVLDAEWIGAATARAGSFVGGSLELGTIKTVQAVIERPASATSVTSFRTRLLPNWRSYAGSNFGIGKVIIHRFDVQEIVADSMVEQQLQTRAELNGLSEAAYVMRVKSGGASAGLEMVAAKNANGGSASSVRISADEIIMDGTVKAAALAAGAVTAGKVAIGDVTNQFPNPTFVDDFSLWNRYPASQISNIRLYKGMIGLGVLIQKAATDTVEYGLRTDAYIANRSDLWDTDVTPGEKLYISATVRRTIGTSGGNIGIYRRIHFTDGRANEAGVAAVASVTNIHVTNKVEAIFEVPEGACGMSWQIYYGSSDASGGGQVAISNLTVRRMTSGVLIEDGAITADKLTAGEVITDAAQIKNAIITEAKITGTLNANKIAAGTALAATVTVSGTALSTVRSNAATGATDPVSRINGGSTRLDPGKITISGSNTLADWRGTSDTTTINGGAIETDSIVASSIKLIDTSTLVPDAGYNDPKSWYTVGGGSLTLAVDTNANSGNVGSRVLRYTTPPNFTSSTAWAGLDSSMFSVQNGASYTFTTKIYVGSAGDFRAVIVWYDVNGASISTEFTSESRTSGGWFSITNIATAPANAVQARARVTIRGSSTATSFIAGRLHVFRQAETMMIQDGAITGAKLIKTEELITETGQIKNATITEAKITGTLNANKITAGTALAATVTVSGTALSTIKSDAATGAEDPGTRINAAATKIDPGKITISGATTLANWRGTTDTTSINGGQIETNSILADSIMVGILPNLVKNGGLQTNKIPIGDLWVSNSAGTVGYTTSAVKNGDYSIHMTRNAVSTSHTITQTAANYMPVNAGEVMAAECWARSNTSHPSTAGFYFRILWFKKDKTVSTVTTHTDIASNQGVTTSWRQFAAQVTVPSDAYYAAVRFFNHTTNDLPTIVYIGGIRFAATNGAVDIRNGAVTADKVSVDSLSALSAVIGTLRTATSGARMEIYGNRIMVYDASNILRVRLGSLV